MTLNEFAGVFSRFFVIGFFGPPFFAVVLVSQLVEPESFPNSYQSASGAAKLAILGGVALLVGLILSGLHHHVTRLFEGYPLTRLHGRPIVGRIHDRILGHWQEQYDARTRLLEEDASPERTRAAIELNRCFPALRTSVLPTRFGNAVRSFETHGRNRYGLDGISAWPRISMLLSDSEREQVSEAQTDAAFFLNIAVMSIVAAAALSLDLLWHPPGSDVLLIGSLAIVALSGAVVYWGAYRAATAAAMRWGSPVRAAYDLHRLELYEQLGLRAPYNQAHERAIARAVNRLLLFGEPIPDAFRRTTEPPKEEP